MREAAGRFSRLAVRQEGRAVRERDGCQFLAVGFWLLALGSWLRLSALEVVREVSLSEEIAAKQWHGVSSGCKPRDQDRINGA